jgi:hypothetical protein
MLAGLGFAVVLLLARPAEKGICDWLDLQKGVL